MIFMIISHDRSIDLHLGLSVKERARMLTTTNPPTSSVDKKNASPSNPTGK